MPFKSQSQYRKFQDLEKKGELAAGTTAQWMAETPNLKALPERSKPKQPTRAKKTLKAYPTKQKVGYF